MALPLILRGARYAALPFAVVVGFVGYNFESLFNRESPSKVLSIQEERDQRILKELEENKDSKPLQYTSGIPKSIFDRSDPKKQDKQKTNW